MSNTKREPLLSNADLGYVKDKHTPEQVRDFYEAARAKDAELIQKLVNALHDSWPSHHEDAHTAYYAAVEAAEAAGFKPSDQ
jgi:hypothetical protein